MSGLPSGSTSGLPSPAPRKVYRIGQIVPSSNVTMETEVPAILRAREAVAPERFTFHSSRMRMTHVTPEQLKAMDADSDRCAIELSIEEAEQQLGKPVVSAAVCTVHQMLRALNLPAHAPGAGHLLSGAYAQSPVDL